MKFKEKITVNKYLYSVSYTHLDVYKRQLLVAMRGRMAEAIPDPNCPPRDLASLSRRLHEWVRELEAIDASAQDDASRTDVTDAPFDATAI